MSILKLHYPVHTLDKQLLLPSGSELSEDTLNHLISSNKTASYQNHSLLQYAKEDLLDVLRLPPYNVIFADQKQTSELLTIMEKVSVTFPVLQAMDYFKNHESYTYRHVLSTFALTILLAKDLIFDYKDMITEVASCPAHDIGKICIPLHILKKSSPLTPEELSILKHHAVAGYVLLSYYLKDSQILSAIIARDHHERKNGSGYPRGISLTDRMVEIVAVSDIYDALISNRPYRNAVYDNRTALEEITGMAERNEIGWDVVKALVAYNRKDKPKFSDCVVSDQKRGAPPQNNFYGVITDENKQNLDDDDK
jgi:HD-GYP domain-containing protein (c-di-GMP phosphodiesterase class II)